MTRDKLFTVLPYVLAAGFLFFGVQKFGATNPVFSVIAERSGIYWFEPIIRMLTGVAEIATAILLVIPRRRVRLLGLLFGLGILGGAIGFHLSPWLGINVPGIGHGLFVTAVMMTALNLAMLLKALPSRSRELIIIEA